MSIYEDIRTALEAAGIKASEVTQVLLTFDKSGELIEVQPVELLDCPECGGRGISMKRFFNFRVEGFCDFCSGVGKVSAQDMSQHRNLIWSELEEMAREAASRADLVEVDDIPF